LSTRPFAYSIFGSVRFAEANTSGLIPCSICAASTSEPEKDAAAARAEQILDLISRTLGPAAGPGVP
jgi:hypothetical protein